MLFVSFSLTWYNGNCLWHLVPTSCQDYFVGVMCWYANGNTSLPWDTGTWCPTSLHNYTTVRPLLLLVPGCLFEFLESHSSCWNQRLSRSNCEKTVYFLLLRLLFLVLYFILGFSPLKMIINYIINLNQNTSSKRFVPRKGTNQRWQMGTWPNGYTPNQVNFTG